MSVVASFSSIVKCHSHDIYIFVSWIVIFKCITYLFFFGLYIIYGVRYLDCFSYSIIFFFSKYFFQSFLCFFYLCLYGFCFVSSTDWGFVYYCLKFFVWCTCD